MKKAMGNENQHYSTHHKHYNQNLHIHNKNTFLPMLCSKPSIKDVTLPRWRDNARYSFDDPLSPRISCIGQVKRNNKIAGIGFSTSHRLSLTSKTSTSTSSSSSSTSPIVNYSKLKKLFSSKNLNTTTTPTISTTTAAAATTISRSCRHKRVSKNHSDENVVSINIENMDPPLPVMKKMNKVEEGSLWQRRSGGHGLKGLQVQQIHHQRICLQPTSV